MLGFTMFNPTYTAQFTGRDRGRPLQSVELARVLEGDALQTAFGGDIIDR